MKIKSNSVTYRYFDYSLKVWMGSVLGAPFLFFSIGFFITKHSNDYWSLIPACMLFSFFEMLFSFLTWLAFWIFIELVVYLVHNNIYRKCLASLTGIVLTVLTFRIFPFFDSFNTTNNDYLLMLCNCVCIGFGAWLLYPAKHAKLTDTGIKSASHEQ